jgi:surface antigen
MKKFTAATCASLALAMLPVPSPADPPPWAPAHGWRRKHDPHYVGYTGRKWEKDYGVVSAGRCNTKAVGAVLGGALGGVVGSQIGKGEERPIAVVAGAMIGAILGAKIGQRIDESDRACMGHALELARERRTVAWRNDATGVAYRLTPIVNQARGDEPCRTFLVEANAGRQKERTKALACRRGEGVWEIVS